MSKYKQGDTALDVMGEYAYVAYHEENVRQRRYEHYAYWPELHQSNKDIWIHVAMTVIGAYNTECHKEPFTRVYDE